MSADREPPRHEPEIIPPGRPRAPFEDEPVRVSVRWYSTEGGAGQPNIFVKIIALTVAAVFAVVLFALIGALVVWILIGAAILFLVVYLAGLVRRRRKQP